MPLARRWIMPEEYRVWKEKMDAVEKKKAEQAVAQQAVEAERVAQLKSGKQARSAAGSAAGAASADGAGNAAPAIQYGSAAEAAEAFKDLLAEMKVSTIAKMKEVQDLCQHDARWEALKSQGEKKQALAEYQVGQHRRSQRLLHVVTDAPFLFNVADQASEAGEGEPEAQGAQAAGRLPAYAGREHRHRRAHPLEGRRRHPTR
jgi:hypothetical protein